MIKRILFLLMFCYASVSAQSIHPDILNKKWNAFWIAVPEESLHDYGVYNFRKVIELKEKPASFIVHVSADNRYKLFVNGQLASLGPARGDLFHWNFETVDIAPYLNTGKNVLGALVWNFGEQRPEAQISLQTAFILQGNTATEEIANTNASWKCIRDHSWQPRTPELIYAYYVAGPGENIDFNMSRPKISLQILTLLSSFDVGMWITPQAIFQGNITLESYPYFNVLNGYFQESDSHNSCEGVLHYIA